MFKIQQDQIHGLNTQQLQSFFAVGSVQHVRALSRQVGPQHPPDLRVVVDKQNRSVLYHCFPCYPRPILFICLGQRPRCRSVHIKKMQLI